MQTFASTAFTSMLTFAMLANIAFGEPLQSGRVNPPTTRPVPSPTMSPADVVKTVVDALGSNDANDTGIKITFSFASPANQQVTGPIDHFIPMVKNPMYEPMLNHRSATYKRLAGDGTHAQELVTLVARNGSAVYFVFVLSKQPDGPFKDCWMTDGVQRVLPAFSPATRPAPHDLPDGQFPA